MANDAKSLLAHSQILAPLSILPSARWSADGAHNTERVITLWSNSEIGRVFQIIRDFGQEGRGKSLGRNDYSSFTEERKISSSAE